jgi:hypothetical protein
MTELTLLIMKKIVYNSIGKIIQKKKIEGPKNYIECTKAITENQSVLKMITRTKKSLNLHE